LFVKECDAVVCSRRVCTHDEGFEVLTLVQPASRTCSRSSWWTTGGDYWKQWTDYPQLFTGRGMISPADTSLYKVTDSIDAAVNEVVNFYRVLSQHEIRQPRTGLKADQIT